MSDSLGDKTRKKLRQRHIAVFQGRLRILSIVLLQGEKHSLNEFHLIPDVRIRIFPQFKNELMMLREQDEKNGS
jgi:hypothetical protein